MCWKEVSRWQAQAKASAVTSPCPRHCHGNKEPTGQFLSFCKLRNGRGTAILTVHAYETKHTYPTNFHQTLLSLWDWNSSSVPIRVTASTQIKPLHLSFICPRQHLQSKMCFPFLFNINKRWWKWQLLCGWMRCRFLTKALCWYDIQKKCNADRKAHSSHFNQRQIKSNTKKHQPGYKYTYIHLNKLCFWVDSCKSTFEFEERTDPWESFRVELSAVFLKLHYIQTTSSQNIIFLGVLDSCRTH